MLNLYDSFQYVVYNIIYKKPNEGNLPTPHIETSTLTLHLQVNSCNAMHLVGGASLPALVAYLARSPSPHFTFVELSSPCLHMNSYS